VHTPGSESAEARGSLGQDPARAGFASIRQRFRDRVPVDLTLAPTGREGVFAEIRVQLRFEAAHRSLAKAPIGLTSAIPPSLSQRRSRLASLPTTRNAPADPLFDGSRNDRSSGDDRTAQREPRTISSSVDRLSAEGR
jgi:hypothetical protein